MGRCYPAEGKLTLLLQALKLCVVALGLLQRVLRADPQGKFANTHSFELHIGVAGLNRYRGRDHCDPKPSCN